MPFFVSKIFFLPIFFTFFTFFSLEGILVFASEGLQYLLRRQAGELLQRYSREMYYGQTDQILFAAKLFIEEIGTQLETMYGAACSTRPGSQVIEMHSKGYIDKFVQKLPEDGDEDGDEQIRNNFTKFAEGKIFLKI